jgi:hypothetical protein
MSESERIRRIQEQANKYIARNKCVDSSLLTMKRQAQASSVAAPATVAAVVSQNGCAANATVTGKGTNMDYSAIMQNSASAASLTPANRASMTTNINQFFSLFKAADPTFYSDHVTDTNGGPPYAFRGTISNTEFGSLKNNFSNYLSSNSTDNQVAQQRLEALNNTRESILAGMSAFTQGQSQVTDRIGGNL